MCDLSDVLRRRRRWAHQPPAGRGRDRPRAGPRLPGHPAGCRAAPARDVRCRTWRFRWAPEHRPGGIPPTRSAPSSRSPVRTCSLGSTPSQRAARCDRRQRPLRAGLTITTDRVRPGAPTPRSSWRRAPGTQPLIVVPIALRLQTSQPRTRVVLDGLLIAGGPVVLEEVGDTRAAHHRGTRTAPSSRAPSAPPRVSRSVPSAPAWSCSIPAAGADRTERRRTRRGGRGSPRRDASTRASMRRTGRRWRSAGARRSSGGLRTVTGVADMAVGDGAEPAGEVDLHECTVIGGIHCTRLDASNSLLVAALAAGDPRPAAVHARRRQVGCVRYSFVPEGSRTGKRFRCAPTRRTRHAIAARPRRGSTSVRFGDPAYLQMSTSAHRTRSARGADDESEMGVTHLLFTPQREANLAAAARRVPAVRPGGRVLLCDADGWPRERGCGDMGADLSRVRFDPRRDHAGVVLQQGRLLLDADWNELVAILERRIRAEAADLDSGPRGRHRRRRGRAADDARRIQGDARRRCADDRPGSDVRRRAAGREPRRRARSSSTRCSPSHAGPSTPRTTSSPTCPDPPTLPESGSHLAYLDVWQREVTHIEAPDLVERRSASTPPHARRRCGRCGCTPSAMRACRCATLDADIPGWARSSPRPAPGSRVDTIAVDDERRPVRLASDRRLPRTGEPDLPGRDPQRRRAGHRDLQVVARQRLGGVARPRGAPARARPCGRRRSARTPCWGSTTATGSRSPTTTASWPALRASCAKSGVMKRTAHSSSPLPCPRTCARTWRTRLRCTCASRRWDQRGQVKSAAGTDLDNLDSAAATGAITVPAAAGDRRGAGSRHRRAIPFHRGRVPDGRPLDLRGPHSRHLGGGADRRASARHPPPLRPARRADLPGRRDRLPDAVARRMRMRRGAAATAPSA